MWKLLAAIAAAYIVALILPLATTAKCIHCWKGGLNNHRNYEWRQRSPPTHYPPSPQPRLKQLTVLERLARRRAQAARIAMQYIGTPYRWGGSDPRYGFDCSGLVAFAMRRVGIHVPHSSWAQMHLGVSVRRWQIKAGDVLFFNSGGHVALAISHTRYIEAPYSGASVRVRMLTRELYAARRFVSPKGGGDE